MPSPADLPPSLQDLLSQFLSFAPLSSCRNLYLEPHLHGSQWRLRRTESRPRELPPQPLAEPDVNLATHPAPIMDRYRPQ